MRKIIYTILFVIFSINFLQAQNCCPQFSITDGQNIFPCKNDERCKNEPGQNGGSVDGHFACKNTTTNYYVFPNLPGYTYTWTVSGGTPTSFVGNPVSVTWGNGTSGQVSVIISNGDGSCKDTVTSNYCLLTPPTALFSYIPNTSICSSTNIQFVNASSGGNTYYWDFGDGNSSILSNPIHQYGASGTYTVTLTVSNVFNGERCGCTARYSTVVTVDPGTSPEIISSCSKMLCPGDTASYCVVSSCGPFSWTVNGGTIVGPPNQSCVSVLWNTPPTNFPTYVTVSTGTCSGQCSSVGTLNVPVLYNNIPIVGDTVVCQNTTHSYVLPAIPGTFYSWSVTGGGQIVGLDSNTVECNVLWTGPPGSTEFITCTYTNPFTGCSGTTILQVNIKPKFEINGTNPACVGSLGTYLVGNLGNANWTVTPNIGFTPPGPFLNTSNFGIQWNTAGNYTFNAVPVIATDYCTPSASLQVVVNDTPTLGPIAGVQLVCSGESYVYSVPTNMNAGQFFWTVSAGDMILSEMGAHKDSVVVQWNGTGPHTLTVYQIVKGCASSPVTINVTNVIPPQIITGTPVACVDQSFTYAAFNNLPVGSYTWSIKPVNAGTIVSGQGSSSVMIQWHGSTLSTTLFDTVYVTTCAGVDSFYVTVTSPAPTSIIKTGFLCSGITLSSTLSGVSYQWYINDNMIPSSNSQSININQAGNYMVYVYQVPGGCPSIANINVLPDKKPYLVLPCGTGIFEYLPPDTTVIKYCANTAISSPMSVNAPPGLFSYQWYKDNYGNPVGLNASSYTATQTGLYWVVVTNTVSLCIDTLGYVIIDTICCTANYTMNFTNTGCDTVDFKATINPIPNPLFPYHWCFGDGASATTVVDSVEHKYLYAGQYTVCVYTKVEVGSDTCAVNYCRTIDVPLVAEFDTLVNCATVTLTDLSTFLPSHAGYTINWSTTGPGTFSPSNSVANPTITYTTSGTYLVTLTISFGGCTSVITKPVTVYVINAGISGPSTVCAGTFAPFTASPNLPLLQYAWDFGDNATSFIPVTNHSYPVPPPSSYTIKLVITDTHGCKDSTTQPITVINAPPLTITPDSFICPGNLVVLTVTPGFQTYQWYFNGNAINLATNNTYTTGDVGEYWVVATSNNGGCAITSPKTKVFHKPLPIADIQGASIACISGANPANVFLYNSTVLPNYTYDWVIEGVNVTLSNTYYLSDLVNTPGSYSYVLTVTDTSGCSVSDTFCVIVTTAPQVTIVPSSPGVLCAGKAYTFTAVATPPNPNYIYFWSNGFTGPVMTTGQAGSYSVSVINPLSGCVGYSGGVSISRTPSAILFPVGCDTLCDTTNIIPPLAITTNLTYGIYTIEWFDNGNYGSPIFVGPSFPVSMLSLGNHSISMVVTFGACSDTSSVYSIYVKDCANPIPVKISYFTVDKWKTNAILTWRNEFPETILYYEVLRSINGMQYDVIDKVYGVYGKYTYSYLDSNLLSGKYFYQVRVVDKSGQSFTTSIRMIQFSNQVDNLLIYPNPVVAGDFTISSATQDLKQIKIFNNTGTLIKSIQSNKKIEHIDATGWSKGAYLVLIVSESGEIKTKQVMIVK